MDTERARLGTLRGFGTERATLGTFRGFGPARARLGTFRGLCTERARLGTFRGFGTERARLDTFKKNLKKMLFFYSNRAKTRAKPEVLHEKLKTVLPVVIWIFFFTPKFTNF